MLLSTQLYEEEICSWALKNTYASFQLQKQNSENQIDLHLLKTFREENTGKNPGKTNFPEAGVQGGTPEVFAWWR